MNGEFKIDWIDRGRPPRHPPNPYYPDGCHVDAVRQEKRAVPTHDTVTPSCVAQIPYPCPHPNTGAWMISCLTCGANILITAASRPDDPRSVRLPCREIPT